MSRVSLPLQRAITVGADVPFHKIPAKLTEHYGISVPVQLFASDYREACREVSLPTWNSRRIYRKSRRDVLIAKRMAVRFPL